MLSAEIDSAVEWKEEMENLFVTQLMVTVSYFRVDRDIFMFLMRAIEKKIMFSSVTTFSLGNYDCMSSSTLEEYLIKKLFLSQH